MSNEFYIPPSYLFSPFVEKSKNPASNRNAFNLHDLLENILRIISNRRTIRDRIGV